METSFDTANIKKLVLHLGIPAMLAQLFNILYSITDRIFVGHIPEAGKLALAGIGVCAPALTVITGFASLVGIGGVAVMSISLGKREEKRAQAAVNNAFLLLCILSVLLTTLFYAVKQPLLYLLGCSDVMYPYAAGYYEIYVAGTFAVLLGNGMNYFILGQGFPRQGMMAVVIGAVLNTVLDPVFIFFFGMGVRGAAIATVAAQIGSMLYVLFFLGGKNAALKIGFGQYSIKMSGKIASIGCMSFLIVLLDNLVVILLNMMLRKYGKEALGDQYISAAAVVQSVMVIAYFPANGLTSGCGTLYGYHYGAGNYKKLMEVFRYVLLSCFAYMLVWTLLAQSNAPLFAGLFVRDEEGIALAASFIRKYTLGLFAVSVQYAFVDGLTAMGKVKYALPLSLFRKLIYIIAILGLPMVTSLKNIFWAGTISDVVGASFTLLVFLLVIRPRVKKELI